MVRREDEAGSVRPIEAVSTAADEDPTWERLESQIRWYSKASRQNQRRFKQLKLLEITVAAALPVVAGLNSPVWVTGGPAQESRRPDRAPIRTASERPARHKGVTTRGLILSGKVQKGQGCVYR